MSSAGDDPPTQSSDPPPPSSPGGSGAIPWPDASDAAHAFARRLFGYRDRHLAEDVAQEALMRLQPYDGRVKAGWKPLLYTILLNAGRERFSAEDAKRAKVRPDTTEAENAPADVQSVPDLATNDERLAAIEQRLEQLDEKFGAGTRAIIDFRFQGMAWDPISHATGIPVRTCSDRYTKAMTWLCDRLSLQPAQGGRHD